MVGAGEDAEAGRACAGKDRNARRKIFENPVWERPGSGGFGENSGTLWAQQDSADWGWQGRVDGGNSGTEPEAPAGDAGFGVLLERDVSKIETGIGEEVSEARMALNFG